MAIFVTKWSQFAVTLSVSLLCSLSLAADVMLLEFTAESCQACKAIEPAVQSLQRDGWIVRQVDAYREPNLTQRWKVDRLPTLIVLVDGEEVDRVMGEANESQLSERLARFASSNHLVSPPQTLTSSPRVSTASATTPFSGPFPALSDTPNSTPNLQEVTSASFATGSSSLPANASNSPALSNSGVVEGPSTSAVQSVPVSMADPMATSVRIRVDEGNTFAFGTGTIIAQQGDDVLVMTCGHLFRTNRGQTPITVEYFQSGRLIPTQGAVVDYQCDEIDIALITFKSSSKVQVASMRPSNEPLQEGETVASIGCDHGADPSRRDSRITKLNRYLGAPNVEAAGAPVQGRSGGGLFDRYGRLVGVCYASDGELDEGLYSAPAVLYQQVAKVGMSHLYDSPAKQSVSEIANNTTPIAPRTLAATEPIRQSSSLSNANSLTINAPLEQENSIEEPLANSQVPKVNQASTLPTYADNFPDSRTRELLATSNSQPPISISSGVVSNLTVIVRTSDGQQRILDIPDAPASLVQALQLQASDADGHPTAIASRR